MMKKNLVIFSSLFVFLFSSLVKFVSAATYVYEPIFDFEVVLPRILLMVVNIPPGSIFHLPFWGFLMSLIVIWALFFVLVKKIHLFADDEHKKLRYLVSFALTLIILFATPAAHQLFRLIALTGWIFVVGLIVLLIWAGANAFHKTSSEFAEEWSRDDRKRRNTMAQSREDKTRAQGQRDASKETRRLFKRGIRLGRRELKSLGKIGKQIRDLDTIRDATTLQTEKTRVTRNLRGALRINRIERRIAFIVTTLAHADPRTIALAHNLELKIQYLKNIVGGINDDISGNRFAKAADDIGDAENKLKRILGMMDELEDRAAI